MTIDQLIEHLSELKGEVEGTTEVVVSTYGCGSVFHNEIKKNLFRFEDGKVVLDMESN